MFTVKIYKKLVLIDEKRFESYQQAIDWIEQGNAKGLWQTEDKKEITPDKTEFIEVEVQPELRDENGNVIQERITEVREFIVGFGRTIVHPATHVCEIIDEEQERKLERRRKLELVGEILIDQMAVRNFNSGFTLSQITDITRDDEIVRLRNLLSFGYLEFAKDVIERQRERFVNLLGVEYVEWLLGEINNNLN